MGASCSANTFVAKKEVTLFYKDHRLLKWYIPDLLVADHVLVELKSVSALSSDHEAQLFNYMRITHQPVGYLVNFGPIEKMEWKRFVISQFAKTRPATLADL
jgi:GxxExxY protein